MKNISNYKHISTLLILIGFFIIPTSYAQTSLPTITFSADRYQITNGENVTVTWSTTNASTCSGYDNWSGYKGTSGSYTSKPAFSVKYTLKCWSSTGALSTESIYISVQQIQLPQLTVSANQTTINRGESTLISWNSYNTDKCIASGGWSGNYISSGSISVTPSNTTSYTLTCTNSLYRTNKSITIFVRNGVGPSGTNIYTSSTTGTGAIDVIMVTNPQIIYPGQSAKLNWGAVNASACYGSGAWSGPKPTYGSDFVSPTQSSNYVLTCSNGTNLKTVTATVIVSNSAEYYPSPTPSSQTNYTGTQNKTSLIFSATPIIIKKGYTSTLKWQSSNTTTCIATGGWSGIKPPSGIEYVWPVVQTNYVLTCYGETGSTYASALVSIENTTASGGSNSGNIASTPKPTKTPASSPQSTSSTSNKTLKVTCAVNKDRAEVGEEVLFTSKATGGIIPYTYIWAGAISKSGALQKVAFGTTGTKVATLTVSDNLGRTSSVNCATKIFPKLLARTPNPETISPTQNSTSTQLNPAATSSQIILPNGEVLSVSGSCILTNILMCSDGKIYDLNSIKNMPSSTTIISTTPNQTATSSVNSANISSMFIDDDNRFSWISISIIIYMIILTVAGLSAIIFRFLNRKTRNQN